MVEPLFWLDHPSIHRYAEVGCGFGLGLDFAREALGWTVQGYDPSPAAAAGREQLGLPITLDYLRPETLDGIAPHDLILASEVIEHIPDPHAFLNALTPAIAPTGWQILTTPNAASIHPSTSAATLLLLLTPGYHLVLYSATSLRRLMEDHGFGHHYLRETATTLTIVASRQPFAADPHAVLDRERYRAYLQQRLATLDPDQPLAQGLAGRLFKEQVNAGHYLQALHTFADLVASLRHRYGLDLDNPDQVLGSITSFNDFARFAVKWPLHLCGLAYRRGFLALHHEQAVDRARSYFTLGEVAGSTLRQSLRGIGAVDGETEHLVELCRLGVLDAAVAARDFPTVSAWLGRFKAEPACAPWQDQAHRLIVRCFTDRALSGDHDLADLHITAVPVTTPADLPWHGDRDTGRFLLARGLYALNRRGDATGALDWLAAAHEYLKELVAEGDDLARALLPTLVVALVYAQATVSPAEALLTTLIRHADAERSAREHQAINTEVFQRLVHAGAYREAAQLEPLVLDHLSASPLDLTANLALTLGILALNLKGDHAVAHGWLLRASQLAPTGSDLTLLASQLADRTAAHLPAPNVMPSSATTPPVT